MEKNQYNKVESIFDNLISVENKLKEESIKGIKEILGTMPNKDCKLIDNGIYVTFYEDGCDYNTINAESIYMDSDNDVHVITDNNSDIHQDDIKAELTYYLYVSMFQKFIEKCC